MGGKKKAPPLNNAALVTLFVLSIVALFFEAIGSPYDVIKLHHDMYNDTNGCYSLWGRKRCGGSHPKAWHDARFRRCGVFEATMKAGATFTIISLFAYGMTVIVTTLALGKCLKSKVPIIGFLAFGLFTGVIPFACVAGLYHNSTCSFGRFKDQGKYAPGFEFLIVAWCLGVIGFVVSIFL